jgi:hypothetical protein
LALANRLDPYANRPLRIASRARGAPRCLCPARLGGVGGRDHRRSMRSSTARSGSIRFERWLDPANFDAAGRQKVSLTSLNAGRRCGMSEFNATTVRRICRRQPRYGLTGIPPIARSAVAIARQAAGYRPSSWIREKRCGRRRLPVAAMSRDAAPLNRPR